MKAVHCIWQHELGRINYSNFLHDTASQLILIPHDSGVPCKLYILDRELDHFSCPILLHDSSVDFTHKISCCQMQCITFMEANRHDSLWIFYSVRTGYYNAQMKWIHKFYRSFKVPSADVLNARVECNQAIWDGLKNICTPIAVESMGWWLDDFG